MDVERTVRKTANILRDIFQEEHIVYPRTTTEITYVPTLHNIVHKMLQRSILCMQGTQYTTIRSILCRGAFCGSTVQQSVYF